MTVTLKVKEHEVLPLAVEHLISGGALDLHADAQTKGGFKIVWRGSSIELTAGGRIGVVALNDRVTVEVVTRVPIANLERLLARARVERADLGEYHGFGTMPEAVVDVDDLVALDMIRSLRTARLNGFPKQYLPRSAEGSHPHGRIKPGLTAVRTASSGRAVAVFDFFERTADNDVNRFIAAGGEATLLRLQARPGSGRLIRDLSLELARLPRPTRSGPLFTPSLKPSHSFRPEIERLVELARFVLSEHGVQFRGRGDARMPSFLLNMEKTFEQYLRSILIEGVSPLGWRVLDGNEMPPFGGGRMIFDRVGPFKNEKATPDIVIMNDENVSAVIEVKYKPCEQRPDRAHLEQTLLYALTHRTKTAIIVYPAKEGQTTDLTFVGEVNAIRTYKAIINLNAGNLQAEEQSLIDQVIETLR